MLTFTEISFPGLGISLNPSTGFTLGHFTIRWYGVIIALGLCLAVWYACRRCRQFGISEDHLIDGVLWVTPFAIICARAYYCIFSWEQYAANPISCLYIWEGGLAIYGGVIGGIATAVVFCKIQKFPLLKLMDFAMPSLLLGQIIGRWGNFMNQEAFGNLITDPKLQFFPYGVYIEDLAEWHQATFFYESAANLVLFIMMMIVARRAKKDGWMTVLYLVGYGIIRCCIEGLRTDSLYLIPGLRVSQLLSAVLIGIGLGIAWGIRSGRLRSAVYKGNYCLTNGGGEDK